MVESTAVRWSQSASIKVVVIGLLTVVLSVPLVMVWALVSERASRRNEVRRELGAVWGRRQTVGGIALMVPFVTQPSGAPDRPPTSATFVALPETLEVDITLAPESRRRGIFSVVLYRAEVTLTGRFARPDLSRLGAPPLEVLWDRAALGVAVSDVRGIASIDPLAWGSRAAPFEPGETGVFGSSLSAAAPWEEPADAITFAVRMTLTGTEGLSLVPTGRITQATLESSWPHPGFVGAFLPESQTVGPEGFSASWRLSHLARGYPQFWVADAIDRSSFEQQVGHSTFGVDLVQPVDHYRQTERAVKYGFLFILFTLAVLLLAEVMSGVRLHPIQYLLAGAPLVVFFLLLLSLSEHIRFDVAYAAAAAATIAAIAGYAGRILDSTPAGSAVALWLAAVYGVLYMLLQLEDLALLVGSLTVFVVLVSVMYLTRRVNWYAVGQSA